jgi:hypothetical protein
MPARLSPSLGALGLSAFGFGQAFCRSDPIGPTGRRMVGIGACLGITERKIRLPSIGN